MKSRRHLPNRFVSYLRVSTDKQGIRGLGIEAQRNAVTDFIAGLAPETKLVAEYVEVESGKTASRPMLLQAIGHAKNAAATLIIAKLDRLSRDVHFLTGLEKAGIEFVACDMPNANRLTITILAAVAEHERELISQRTRAALAVAKTRIRTIGQRLHPSIKRLGNPEGAACLRGRGNSEAVRANVMRADETARRLAGIIASLEAESIITIRDKAHALNERGVVPPRGGIWHPTSVSRLVRRVGSIDTTLT
jgi:DNA invertase Pin-like site-specific DNA recombinase